MQVIPPRIFGSRRALALLMCLLVLASLQAFDLRFVQDDAFISFRYADNWARGLGPVWNAGERVEGYTNPLWMVLMSLGLRGGFEPVGFSYVLGIACLILTITATWVAVRALGGRVLASMGAVVALCANYSFVAYATGGLETQLEAATFAWGVAVVCLLARGLVRERRGFAAFSVVAGIAAWNRLDSAVFFAVPALYVGARLLERRPRPPLDFVALLGPATLGIVTLAAFKLFNYGHFLPNTFYVKGTGSHWARGAGYVGSFFLLYGLVVPLAGAVGGFLAKRDLWRRSEAPLWIALAAAGSWLLYVVKVGGDFMEFRLMVPVLPVIVTAIFGALGRELVGAWVLTAVAAATFVPSKEYADKYRVNGPVGGVEGIRSLHRHIVEPQQAWAEIGQRLGEDMDHDGTVAIAVMAAGAIPFYSRLKTIDMLGLSDEHIARHGERLWDRAGHSTIGTLDYYVERRVNLVIHPWHEYDPENQRPAYTAADAARYVGGATPLPPEARIVEMKLHGERRLRMLYLLPHPRIEAAIASGVWKVLPVGTL